LLVCGRGASGPQRPANAQKRNEKTMRFSEDLHEVRRRFMAEWDELELDRCFQTSNQFVSADILLLQICLAQQQQIHVLQALLGYGDFNSLSLPAELSTPYAPPEGAAAMAAELPIVRDLKQYIDAQIAKITTQSPIQAANTRHHRRVVVANS